MTIHELFSLDYLISFQKKIFYIKYIVFEIGGDEGFCILYFVSRFYNILSSFSW